MATVVQTFALTNFSRLPLNIYGGEPDVNKSIQPSGVMRLMEASTTAAILTSTDEVLRFTFSLPPDYAYRQISMTMAIVNTVDNIADANAFNKLAMGNISNHRFAAPNVRENFMLAPPWSIEGASALEMPIESDADAFKGAMYVSDRGLGTNPPLGILQAREDGQTIDYRINFFKASGRGAVGICQAVMSAQWLIYNIEQVNWSPIWQDAIQT